MRCADANETKMEVALTSDCRIFDFLLYTVIGGSLCVFGVVGNALSFVVLQLKDNAKSATPFLLRALAVADSLVLLASVPLYALSPVYLFTGYLQGYYELYRVIMPFLWPLYLIPYTGTILMTVLVSLERYLAVCKPVMSVAMRSVEQSRRHVACVVLFAVLYNIPRFFEYHAVEICSGPNTTEATYELSSFGDNKLYRIIYANLLYFIVMLGGPLLSLAFFNVKLITALKAQKRRRREMTRGCGGASGGGGGGGGGHLQQDLTLILVVVIFAFSLCQTPTFVDHILWTVVNKTETHCGNWHYYYTAVADTLAILNSSINFIIYVLTSRKFRQGLVTLFARTRRIGESGIVGALTPSGRSVQGAVHHRLTDISVCPCQQDSDQTNRLFEASDEGRL